MSINWPSSQILLRLPRLPRQFPFNGRYPHSLQNFAIHCKGNDLQLRLT